MIIVNYSRFFINFDKVYFSKKYIKSNADIINYTQYEKEDYNYLESFLTLIIDLTNSEVDIRKNIRKNYINEINQAIKKYGIYVEFFNKPDTSALALFVKRYNQVSIKKNYPKIKVEDLEGIKNNILISYGMYGKNIVCGHLYIYDKKRLRLLNSYSVSYLDSLPIYKISSMANKYLHYKDILYAKNNGFLIYDFGGVFNKASNTSGITNFKLGFGKDIEKSFNFTMAKTYKGKISLFIIRYLNFNTLFRTLFLLRIYFQEYIMKSNLYFCNLESKSKFYNYFTEAYIEFFNIKDIHKLINYKKGDKIIFLGVNNAFLFQFLRKLSAKFITIIESNFDKINYLNYELKKLKNNDISLLHNDYLPIDMLSNFNYLFINDRNIRLEDLKSILNKVNAYNKRKKYYIIYFNPIYNYIFTEYKLNLIYDLKSVLSTRVHIYSNF